MPNGPFAPKDQMEILSLGTEFALTEMLGAAAGYWLDNKLGTLPWCLVGGVIVGFALGFWRVVSAAKAANQEGKHGRS